MASRSSFATIRIPKYRRHKASGQSVVTIGGHDHYLGPHGTRASKLAYDRAIAEWIGSGRSIGIAVDIDGEITVVEVLAAFWRHAKTYYVDSHGQATKELMCYRYALAPARRLYGDQPVSRFGPLALKAVRQTMIDSGWSRSYTNRQVNRLRHVFKWATENELVPPSIYHGLQAVTGLQRGRSGVRETQPVKPVPNEYVHAIKPYVSLEVWAMIGLQLLTGMRAGEVTAIRGCDLNTSGAIWEYSPPQHKAAWRGHTRVVFLGPRAQEVIKPFLKPQLESYLFSPADAEGRRNAERRAKRKTPMTPSQRKRAEKADARRRKRDKYDTDSYRRAIKYGIAKANRLRLAENPEAHLVPDWHPHQLRHSAATQLRKEYGIEAARIVLGHRSPAMTELYAELDHVKARLVVEKAG